MTTDNKIGTETVVTPQTPTAEAQLKTVQDELAKVKQELESKDKGLRTAHQTLTAKDRELKETQGVLSRLEGLEQTQKILAAMIAEKNEATGEIEPSRKLDYLKKFEDIQKDIDTKRKQADETAKRDVQIAEWQTKADETKARTESLGLTEEDEAYHEIRHLVTEGDFKLADIKLKKLESQKKSEKEKEKPTETEEQRIERKAKELLQAKGVFKADTGVPSGSGGGKLTVEMVAKMSPDERFARRKEIDAMPLG